MTTETTNNSAAKNNVARWSDKQLVDILRTTIERVSHLDRDPIVEETRHYALDIIAERLLARKLIIGQPEENLCQPKQ